MDLLVLHDPDVPCCVKHECVDILNAEWPRSRALRERSVHGSREELPACMALVQKFGSEVRVLGTARVSRLPGNSSAAWIESVVVHPVLRGKGVGKHLMHRVEQVCQQRWGMDRAYLMTVDRQVFYSRMGYSFTEPVVFYGGNVSLPDKFRQMEVKSEENGNCSKEQKSSCDSNSNKTATGCTPGACAPPPPPPPPTGCSPGACPPPPPPPMPKQQSSPAGGCATPCSDDKEEEEDVIELCSKLFKRPTAQELQIEPLAEPPPKLGNKDSIGPIDKNSVCCRIGQHKDYMMKRL